METPTIDFLAARSPTARLSARGAEARERASWPRTVTLRRFRTVRGRRRVVREGPVQDTRPLIRYKRFNALSGWCFKALAPDELDLESAELRSESSWQIGTRKTSGPP
jgi:hypothetical protein